MGVVCGSADIDITLKFRRQHLGIVSNAVLDVGAVLNQHIFLAVPDKDVPA